MQTERIFHYTSIESLALILQSQNIRFTRLDKFDDVTESQTHSGVGFGKYLFASCWTQVESESIAQWGLYGDGMEGVRIELPVKPFRKIRLESVPGFTVSSDLQGTSPLATRELYGKNYAIAPMAACSDEFFQGPVEYVSNVTARWAAAVRRTPNPSNPYQLDLHIEKMYDLVRLKSKIWAFQSEYRFYLFAMPMLPPYEPDGTNLPTVEQMISSYAAIQRNVDPVVTFIDVPLDHEALDQLVIRTGPLTTDADRARVAEIVRQFAPNAEIVRSALDGQIRHRKKPR